MNALISFVLFVAASVGAQSPAHEPPNLVGKATFADTQYACFGGSLIDGECVGGVLLINLETNRFGDPCMRTVNGFEAFDLHCGGRWRLPRMHELSHSLPTEDCQESWAVVTKWDDDILGTDSSKVLPADAWRDVIYQLDENYKTFFDFFPECQVTKPLTD